MAPPDCTSNAQIETHIGSVCRVLGTWELRQFYGKKGNVKNVEPSGLSSCIEHSTSSIEMTV